MRKVRVHKDRGEDIRRHRDAAHRLAQEPVETIILKNGPVDLFAGAQRLGIRVRIRIRIRPFVEGWRAQVIRSAPEIEHITPPGGRREAKALDEARSAGIQQELDRSPVRGSIDRIFLP